LAAAAHGDALALAAEQLDGQGEIATGAGSPDEKRSGRREMADREHVTAPGYDHLDGESGVLLDLVRRCRWAFAAQHVALRRTRATRATRMRSGRPIGHSNLLGTAVDAI